MRLLLALPFACLLAVACGSSDTPPAGIDVVKSGSSAAAPPSHCSAASAVTGHATWYSITGASGACGLPYSSYPYFGAMNQEDFRDSAACGTCVSVTYQGKTHTLTIVNLCPVQGNEQWCGSGGHHIDMGQAAFALFADPSQGVLDTTTWKYVACTVQGGITYTWKAESSEWWAEVVLANYPYEIATLEFQDGGGNWVAFKRTNYGYFQITTGMGPGPYTLRVTDVNGSTVTDTGVPLRPGGTVEGAANFGACP